MAKRTYAKRYAQAVFKIALENKDMDTWQSDLRKIARLAENPSIVALLESPKFRFEDKTKLVSERIGDISPLAMGLVSVLVAKGRLNMASDIVDDYERLRDSYLGIEQAEVTTAVPLDEAEKLMVGERLGEIFGKKIVVNSRVDSSLLGGMIVRVDDKLMDGSTRSKLETLKKELAGTAGASRG